MTLSDNLPAEQGTNLAAARIIDHAGTSNAPAPVHPVRSGRSNLQRFTASMNCIGGGESVNREESLDNDVSTLEGVEKYEASVLAWAFNKKHSSSVMDRTHAMQRINAWLHENNPRAPLDFSGLKFQHLPPLPSTLQHLNAHGVGVKDLPKKLPRRLISLDVSENFLLSLPQKWPDTLKKLNADKNYGLKDFPKNLPDTLTHLTIGNNRITHLPENLPRGLVFLDINHTRITKVSQSLLQAAWRSANPCHVNTAGLPERIRESFDINGTHRSLGILNEYRVGRTSPTLDQAVQAWYGTRGANPKAAWKEMRRKAAWKKIHQKAQTGALADPTVPLWTLLDSLKACAEHPSETGDKKTNKQERKAMRAAFKLRVTHLLDGLQENKALRLACFNIAYNAVETCHDNIALGFEEMELEHLKARAAQGEFAQRELAKLGVDTFKLVVLDELAKEKALRSGNADEAVEVVLGYRTKLAAVLDLPTKTKAMRYARTAQITEADLVAALDSVMQAATDSDRIVSFLKDWAPWQKDLERRHPEEFDAAALERGEEALFEDMATLNETYEKHVKEQGEYSTDALDTKAKMNALKGKYETREQDLFFEARERLTKDFVSTHFLKSNPPAENLAEPVVSNK